MQRPLVSTLCQETKKHRNQKVGSEGTPKLDPYWKLQPVVCTANVVEIRVMSMNIDNSHSWARISHGSNKFVTNLNDNDQEISEVQPEEYALKLNASDFSCRLKDKGKPQRREPAGSSKRTIPIWAYMWTDVEPAEKSISDDAVSRKLIHLLRHGSLSTQRRRWSD